MHSRLVDLIRPMLSESEPCRTQGQGGDMIVNNMTRWVFYGGHDNAWQYVPDLNVADGDFIFAVCSSRDTLLILHPNKLDSFRKQALPSICLFTI